MEGFANTVQTDDLSGPPGTGKTYESIRLAQTLLGVDPDTAAKEGTEEHAKWEKMRFGLSLEGESENPTGQWAIVQFHPSYNYEDFVRGIRISTATGEADVSGGVEYQTVDRGGDRYIIPPLLPRRCR